MVLPGWALVLRVGWLLVRVNTVKTHVRNLYAKLGTHRRAEAVARARSLGLLAPSARQPRSRPAISRSARR